MKIQKKNILKIVNLLVFLMIILNSSCKEQIKHTQRNILIKPGFTYIEKNSFMVNGKKFFPLMLNYIICLRDIEGKKVFSCIKEYENPDCFEFNTLPDNQKQLKSHLQLIKEMGFNSLRLVFDRVYLDNGKYYYDDGKKGLSISSDSEIIINALDEYIKLVEKFNLKVMLLIKAPVENEELENFTVKLLKKFNDNSNILAFDFFNEPLYFDINPVTFESINRSKKDAYNIVFHWKELMDLYSPNHLFTIGFSEPIEVFEWDPALLPVDFVTFHTYHPLRVPNEIYWYSKYAGKPWMIGETALPSDGDSIKYEEQLQFFKDVYKKVISCGGMGLAWWQFQEIPNTHFEAQYTGLLTHKSLTQTNDSNYTIIGTLKPAAYIIKELSELKTDSICKPSVNYYNMMGYNNYILQGRIVNVEKNSPIEGAVIRGWNEDWSVGLNTFSDENGCFSLYSNDECVHFEVSAPKMSKVKFNYKAVYNPTYKHNYNFNNLPDKKLEYHSISYKPFLVNRNIDLFHNNKGIFEFDKSKFNKAKFKGEMKDVKLETLKY